MAKPDLVAKYRSAHAQARRCRTIRSMRRWSRAWTRASAASCESSTTLGLTDNTLVIFTSDNGGLATAKGPTRRPRTTLRCARAKAICTKAAFACRWSSTGPRRSSRRPPCDAPVSSYRPVADDRGDLRPAESTKPVDGVSMLPLLKQAGPLAREAAVLALSALQPARRQARRRDSRGRFQADRVLRARPPRAVQRGQGHERKHEPHRSRSGPCVERTGREAGGVAQEVDAQMMRPNPDFMPDTQAADGTSRWPPRRPTSMA